MTARRAGIVASLGLALGLGACTSFYEIPIETPIRPKLDVSAFRRVLVVGFIAGGTDDVDANLETVRLLRSQLRAKSRLAVIEVDPLPLEKIAAEHADAPAGAPAADGAAGRGRGEATPHAEGPRALRAHLRRRGLLEEARRGVPGAAHRDGHDPVHAAAAVRHGGADAAGAGRVRPQPRGPDPDLHGAQGLRAEPEVRLHRRPHRRHALLGDLPRGDPVQRAAEHARAVVLLRAHGPAACRASSAR